MNSCMSYPARNHGAILNSFLTPNDIAVKRVAEDIKNTLVRDNIEDRITAAFNFVALTVVYVSDKRQFGKGEWWQYPCETLGQVITTSNVTRLYGDCEDSSFLLASILLALDVPSSNVRVGISECHAWVECKLGHTWYLFETTSDNEMSSFVSVRSIVGKGYIYNVQVYVYQDGCCYGK